MWKFLHIYSCVTRMRDIFVFRHTCIQQTFETFPRMPCYTIDETRKHYLTVIAMEIKQKMFPSWCFWYPFCCWYYFIVHLNWHPLRHKRFKWQCCVNFPHSKYSVRIYRKNPSHLFIKKTFVQLTCIEIARICGGVFFF